MAIRDDTGATTSKSAASAQRARGRPPAPERPAWARSPRESRSCWLPRRPGEPWPHARPVSRGDHPWRRAARTGWCSPGDRSSPATAPRSAWRYQDRRTGRKGAGARADSPGRAPRPTSAASRAARITESRWNSQSAEARQDHQRHDQTQHPGEPVERQQPPERTAQRPDSRFQLSRSHRSSRSGQWPVVVIVRQAGVDRSAIVDLHWRQPRRPTKIIPFVCVF